MYQTILVTVKVSLERSNEQIWDGRGADYKSGGVYTETAIPATYIKRVVNIALGKRL